ncbi:MAG: glycogen-binding domain-containing protein [Verrucomicrobiae bacterium]|nr:glycogen-binding domain-containing protein [Verrucomicrobiae bacterium]
MNTVHGQAEHSPHITPHSAKPHTFYCAAPDAQTVELAGDFSDWSPVPMERSVDGWWFVLVELAHGDYRYRFLVDGNPVLDPNAGVIRDEQGEQASLMVVS